MQRLVFVCSGNICRSPFGEHVALRHGFSAVSMGLLADSGRSADAIATRSARKFGIDLSGHRAQRFNPGQVRDGDLVLGFEVWQVLQIERMLLGRDVQVRLVGAVAGPRYLHLHDPYGLGESYFATSFTRIERAVLAITNRIAPVPTV